MAGPPPPIRVAPKAAPPARRTPPPPKPAVVTAPDEDYVHLLTGHEHKDKGPIVVTTRCGLAGPPRMPDWKNGGWIGHRTTGWASQVTCPACRAHPGVSGPR